LQKSTYPPTARQTQSIKKYGKGKFPGTRGENTTRPGYQEKKGVWGFQLFAANSLSDIASKIPIDSVTPPFRYEEGWSILKVLPETAPKQNFEEAKPEVLSEYQNDAVERRKLEWVKELRNKYPVVINSEILGEAVK